MDRAGRHISPLKQVALLALLVAAVRVLFAVRLRTPLYYPDEYLYTALARSVADGNFARVRGEYIAFAPVLTSLITAPAWLIPDVDLAYRASQVMGAAAFSSAAFPAWILARRIGVGATGAFFVAVMTVVVPDGVYAANMLSEPYAFALFLWSVLFAVKALERPSSSAQLKALAIIFALCLVRLQFIGLIPVYLTAGIIVTGSARAYLRRYWLGIAIITASTLAIALVGLGRLVGVYAALAHFDYSVDDTGLWMLANAFVFAVASGWLLIPGAVVGLWTLAGSRDVNKRAFAVLSIGSILLLLLQSAVFGVNGLGLLERYSFYAVPLVAIGFVWHVERVVVARRLYVVFAYVLALGAVLLPTVSELRLVNLDHAPAFFGLATLVSGDRSPLLVCSPVLACLALAVAWWGQRFTHAVALGAALLCVAGSAATGLAFADVARRAEIPKGDAPAGSAILTWSGASGNRLLKTLFWNRTISHVVVLGGSVSPDGLPYLQGDVREGHLASVGASMIRRPIVLGPETLGIGAGVTLIGGGLSLSYRVPPVLIFGYARGLGGLEAAGLIFIRRDRRGSDVRFRLQNPVPAELAFTCAGARSALVTVGPQPVLFRIRAPRDKQVTCRFAVVKGNSQIVSGRALGVGARITHHPLSPAAVNAN